MVIGFDFDKVFIDYPPYVPYSLIDFLYKGSTYFKSSTKNGKIHYRFPGKLEQRIRILTHYPIFRPLIHENVNTLEKIYSSKKIKTYLVSSRFGFLRRRTEKLLDKYGLAKYFDGIYFNYNNSQPHIFKSKTIEKLKIDTYIDDDIHLSTYLAKKNPKLKIYWVMNNQSIPPGLPKNVTPIKNLEELLKYVKIK